ncbi:Crp/Fnr family transcriptional regulator [Roseibacterium sp. SDUM158017]|uniref:Crp/Fnr family transcriptional regulator n=1 Tax=Roseicyclus salinarum TaxID=3036773 RepID=UPI002415077C|nr:Crp/Fnr family transcriptional regulator [Roseibacterium sp. SDUM158017]MDG4648452.1 Crp/Fnr family transcriptional regulator [Roseibacterium sp. SDUM158017]
MTFVPAADTLRGALRPDGGSIGGRSCEGCALRGAELCRAMRDDGSTGAGRPAVRTFPRGRQILEQGGQPGFLGVIRKGYVRRSTIRLSGKRILLGLAVPGDLVGALAGEASVCGLEAATDVEICLYDSAGVSRRMRHDPRIRQLVLREVDHLHQSLLEALWRYGTLTSRERIIAFLVSAASIMPVEPLPDGALVLTMEIDRRDWADLTNTAVETISRTLRYLEEKDLLTSLSPYRFRIRDLDRLALLAGVEPPGREAEGRVASGPPASPAATADPRRPMTAINAPTGARG